VPADALQEVGSLAGEARLDQPARVIAGLLEKESLEHVAAGDERPVDGVQDAVHGSRLRDELVNAVNDGIETLRDLSQLEDRGDQEERERSDDQNNQQNGDCYCRIHECPLCVR